MKRTKKEAGEKKAKKFADPIKSRTKLVADALEDIEDLPERVYDILCEPKVLQATIGQEKATRHPFNDRLVAIIGEVLDGHNKALQSNVSAKQAAYDELGPTKGTREAAVETAREQETEKKEAFENAKQAVSENLTKVKAAAAAVETQRSAAATADEATTKIAEKKESLEQAQSNSLRPLLDGTVPAEERKEKIDAVVSAGKTFSFDASLMQATVQVLEKPLDQRTGFDATCTEQIQSAFASALQQFAAQIAADAPAKAQRAAEVEEAENAKQLAEATQAELVQQMTAAKDAKDAAIEAVKTSKQGLVDFMPDMKAAGDELDEAKEELADFTGGALAAFNELKEWKDGDFAPPPVESGSGYYETIDGMKLDRGILDACRTAVAGQGDGRVSADDAKHVFEKVADGAKETQKERWTMRYCMQEFKWTEAAHDWIVEECKKVVQEGLQGSPAKKARTEGTSYYETIDGFKCDRGIIDACREAVAGQGDGRISRDDAEKVWAKAADGNKVTQAEKWTLRYCFSSFNWTRAGHDWLLEQLQGEES